MKRILIALALLAGSLALGLPATSAQASVHKKPDATQLEKVQAYVGPSIVNLQVEWTTYMYDRVNRVFLQDVSTQKPHPVSLQFQCTGYVINPTGYIATAGHCVNPLEVYDSFRQEFSSWLATCACYYQTKSLTPQYIYDNFSNHWTMRTIDKDTNNEVSGPQRVVQAAWSVNAGGVDVGKFQPARVIKFQKFSDGDGAVLKVDQDGLMALPLAAKAPKIGSDVVAVGFPGSVDQVTDPDLEPSYKDGALGSKSTEGGGLTTVYEISAATSGGMSGGPVVDNDGTVLGFVDFKNAGETQAFNFMRPASTVLELMPADAKNELDATSKSYRTGLDGYFDGDKAKAVKNLQAVVDEQPTNKFASKYLRLSKKLPNPPKPKSSFPVLPVILGVLVLVVLGGLAALLLSRRGKKSQPAGGPGAPGGPYAAPGGPGGPAAPGAPYAPPGTAAGPMAGGAATAVADRPGPGSAAPPPAAPAAPAAPYAPPPSAAPAPPPATSSSSSSVAPPPPPAPGPSGSSDPEPTAPFGAATSGSGAGASTGFCSNCGTAKEPGKKFCSNCGTAY